jgi:Zn-dependent alcohol dehydrogenase
VTGVGAVNNAARAQQGNSVVIIGAGGVGLNVAQGASLAKCDPIIAVDLRASALSLARGFGATHTIEASENVVEAVRELTKGRGADYVFDTVGAPGHDRTGG